MLPPTPGERFVVCSDGLSNELDDREIMLVARKYADPQIAADQLVARGGAGRGPRQRLGGRRGRRRRHEDDDDDADTAPRAGLPRG